MADSQKTSHGSAGSLRRGGAKVPITLRLDEATFAQLRLLAEAENRSPTNYVETTVLRDLAAKAEAVRVMTMFVPPDAAAAVPGVLLRTEGESDERYTERAALMERLFAVADTE